MREALSQGSRWTVLEGDRWLPGQLVLASEYSRLLSVCIHTTYSNGF